MFRIFASRDEMILCFYVNVRRKTGIRGVDVETNKFNNIDDQSYFAWKLIKLNAIYMFGHLFVYVCTHIAKHQGFIIMVQIKLILFTCSIYAKPPKVVIHEKNVHIHFV